MNLYLVGYRCTGKTCVGQLLASALGWPFVDMDQELELESGMSIREMVGCYGWQYFREREGRLLQRLSRMDNQVVATGGGVVLRPVNVKVMRSSGRVVWLQASPGTIAARMLADDNTARQRPPLLGETASGEIEQMLTQRQVLYEQAMDLPLDTERLSPPEVARRVLDWLGPEVRGIGKKPVGSKQ